jgi:predicted enzyme related to lactoylglutathione lyase
MAETPGQFIWYELITSDIDAAATFYSAVIGWSVRGSVAPGMDYRQWTMGDATIGGLMAMPGAAADQGMRPLWLGYISVANVDAACEEITAAGGGVDMAAWDVPQVGRIAMVRDPQGAPFYVMTPIGEGPSPSFAPGTPGHCGWNELHARDWQTAFAFYGTQFGWRKSEAMDMGAMGTYQLFNAGSHDIGGMMNSPNFPRPTWLYYFGVEDIDAAKQRSEGAGGKTLNGPHEVPGGSWIIQGQDPQGAMFALVGPRTK